MTTISKEEQARMAAELERIGWACRPPRDTLRPTGWTESLDGTMWVRHWGGTTSICSIVQPNQARGNNRSPWSFRVRLFGARRAKDTGVEQGEAATPEEARQKADKALHELLLRAKERRALQALERGSTCPS